jgi:hypothetical protein
MGRSFKLLKWAPAYFSLITTSTLFAKSTHTFSPKAETRSNTMLENRPGSESLALSPNKVGKSVLKFQDEEQIEASMLTFWQLSRGKMPDAALLEKARLNVDATKAFMSGLKRDEKLSRGQQNILRQVYNSENRAAKFKARERFIKFVGAFQSQFPDFATVIPEALTAWGETRNLGGLGSDDTLLLQAKMASVIQVLRNRTQKALEEKELYSQLGESPAKWQVATQRYQFTAFEPYDPNLAELALGPASRNSNKLKVYDQMALKILAKVLFRMNNGDIEIPPPLNEQKTRHYLTPTLVAFSRKKEKEMRTQYKDHPRLAVLRIPHEKPRFLSVVPRWSLQEALIYKPVVLIRELTNTYMEQEIPPQDFVFFQGIL